MPGLGVREHSRGRFTCLKASLSGTFAWESDAGGPAWSQALERPGRRSRGRYGGPWKGLMEGRPLVRCRGAKVPQSQSGIGVRKFSRRRLQKEAGRREASAGRSPAQVLPDRRAQDLGAPARRPVPGSTARLPPTTTKKAVRTRRDPGVDTQQAPTQTPRTDSRASTRAWHAYPADWDLA